MATKLPRPVVFDFETESIEAWPLYPPKPVGVSILLPGERKPKYYAFGHPTENNCTEADAKRALGAAYAKAMAGDGLLCHNAKFDLDCAETHWGLKVPSWEFVHDTMFLVFLDEPHSTTLALKPASERLLGLPPEEQDALRDWLVANKVIASNVKNWGGLICKIPGGLVGKYANGDVTRTKQIFDLLYPRVVSRGMGAAYNRERQLLPILLKNEHQGVQFDVKRAEMDVEQYEKASIQIDTWIRKQLKVGAGFNIDSDTELADALIQSKNADQDLFLLTATGRVSVAKDSLIGAITNAKMLSALQYRARLSTALGTFLKPWYTEAAANNGIVHPSWNQVRQAYGSDTAGARTGRLSASRFMNTPKEFKERSTGKNAYSHPKHLKGLPELPFMRFYMLPFGDEVWCKRDYMQQELRVLGHFGDGVLMEKFGLDPTLDVHDLAAKLINDNFGIPVTRDDTKTLGFGLLYGMGLGALAERLNVDVNTAKKIKGAYLGIFPELKELQDGLKQYAAENRPLTTWGGRQYYCEEAKWSDKYNRMQTYEYKLLNYLIQGSSADCTKEAIIRYDTARNKGRVLLSVHDEINLSVPKKYVKSEMQLLREVMASVEFDVPMLSDGATGLNWGSLTKFEEKAL